MIDFIFYGRTDPVWPSTAVHRLNAVSQTQDFAQRHGGRVSYDFFDEISTEVPLEARPGGAALLEYMRYRRQQSNVLLLSSIDHALGPWACCSLAMFADAAFPVWTIDLGGPLQIDLP